MNALLWMLFTGFLIILGVIIIKKYFYKSGYGNSGYDKTDGVKYERYKGIMDIEHSFEDSDDGMEPIDLKNNCNLED